MFPRTNRLTRARDFNVLRRSRQRARSRFFSLKFVQNKEDGHRVTVVVSTKVSKKAVERNKVKRRVRAALRNHLEKLPYNIDAAIYVHQSAINANYQEIDNDLATLFAHVS